MSQEKRQERRREKSQETRQKRRQEKSQDERAEKKNSKSRRRASICCSIAGTLILVAVILACVPLTLPRLAGYQVYNVISGSMEPALPIGSLVLVKPQDAAKVQEGDIIAFYSATDTGAIITHRVVENQVAAGRLVTKGDANEDKDINPVEYDQFLGKVMFSVPFLGMILQGAASTSGKVAAVCLIIIAVLLHSIAGLLKNRA
ncbi:signal peptidase I [Roseburia hominis]